MKRGIVSTTVLRALSALLFVGAVPGHAASVTVIATGSLSYVDDRSSLLPFPAELGSPIAISITYDSESPDELPGEPLWGRFAVTSMSIQIGASSVAGFPTNEITIGNNIGGGLGDLWEARSSDEAGNPISAVPTFFLALLTSCYVDCDASGPLPLDSDTLLPPQWPSTWNFGGVIGYSIEDRSGPDQVRALASAQATVQSLNVVPVPATAWLLGSGLGLIGCLRRRLTR